MSKYVIAYDEPEARDRLSRGLYVNNLATARQLAVERAGYDACEPRCTFRVFSAEETVTLQDVTDD